MTLKISWWSKPAVFSSALLVVIYALAQVIALWIISLTHEPGILPRQDIPFYFAQQDFILGASLATGLLLYLVVVVLFFRPYLKEVLRAVAGILVLFIYPIVWAIIIAANSSDLFDSQRANMLWRTFDEYFTVKGYVTFGTIGLFVIVALTWRFLESRGRTNQ